MAYLAGLIAAIILIALLVGYFQRAGSTTPRELPYIKHDALFTPAECLFFEALESAVGEHYRVLGKVRVADVIKVMPQKNKSSWQRAFNQINAKHFDFVLCTRGDLAVVAVVELNDSSHRQAKRRERDRFLEAACQAAGLPLLQVPARREYAVPELRSKVAAALGLSQASPTRHQH